MASYFLFANDNRDSMRKNNPDATMSEVGKMLGEAWKNASGTIRSKYEKQQAVLKEQYDVAVENINLQINAKNILSFVKNIKQKK
eukprot:UN02780